MRKNIFLALSLIPIINYSQNTDSSKTLRARIFISAGNSTEYYSDKFFNYIDNKVGFPVRMNGLYNSSNICHTAEGGVNPLNYIYNKSTSGFTIGLGLELFSRSDKQLVLHHIIETNYTQLSGDYYSSTSYEGGETGEKYSIIDTTQSHYSQTIFTLGYKIQPTYKFLFLSFGLNCSINLIKIKQEQKDYINGVVFVEPGNGPDIYYSRTCYSDSAKNFYFIHFPLQLGAGGNVKIKRILLKPVFYFTPNFSKGYNFYTVSLGIMYDFKKNH